MRTLDARVLNEIESLVVEGRRVHSCAGLSSNSLEGDELARVVTWVTRLGQLIRRLYGDKSQQFVAYSNALGTDSFYVLHSGYFGHLSQLVGVANSIKHDIDSGLLVDFKGIIQADIFANFLEMGEHLLNEGYKDAAAVIIGSVLEDGLRKLCERASLPVISDSGKPLTIDPLNTQLAKSTIYSKLVQKQITTWAHVRNSAAHGKYDDYGAKEVEMMLLFVQDFTAKRLS